MNILNTQMIQLVCIFINVQILFSMDLNDIYQLCISSNPSIILQKQTLLQQEGLERSYEGYRDWHLTKTIGYENNLHPPVTELELASNQEIINNQVDYAMISLQKQFKYGTVVSPYFLFETNKYNTTDLNLYQATMNFSISQPLLRFSPSSSHLLFESNKNKSKSELENSNHNLAFQLYSLALAYWDYKTFYEIYSLRKYHVEKAELFYDNMLILIESDLKPQSDIFQLSTNLSQKKINLLQSEQNLLDIKNYLCSKLGITLSEFDKYNSDLIDYPVLVSNEELENIELNSLIEYALKNRSDLKAAQYYSDAAELITRSSKADLLPELTLNTDYNILLSQQNNSFINDGFGNNQIHNFSIYFELIKPFGNNTARGTYIANKALFEKTKINLKVQKEQLALNITNVYKNLLTASKLLSHVIKAENDMQKVYENENIKYEQGLITLLELLILQDQMIFTELSRLQSSNNFAKAIAKYRFTTSQIISLDKTINAKQYQMIMTSVE